MDQFLTWSGRVRQFLREVALMLLLLIAVLAAAKLAGMPIAIGPRLTFVDLGWLAGALYGIARS